MTSWIVRHKIWSSLIALLLVLFVIGAVGGSNKKAPTKATGAVASSSPTPAASSPPSPSTPQASPSGAATPTPTLSTTPVAVPSRVLYVAGSSLTGAAPAPGTCHAGVAADGQPLPDVHCTPGAIDRAVTQTNIHVTICVAGYTTKVRPPVAQTDAFKADDELAYSIGAGELDHLVPLELGGSSDALNLWVEPGSIPNPKDAVENALHAKVCAGQMSLSAAQMAVAVDWTTQLTTTPVAPTTAPPVVAPTAAPPAQTSSGTPLVHAGNYCSTAGATGVTSTGKPMVCKTTATDSRLRWRAP